MSESANSMREAIENAISEHPVILFMKGTPDSPACGFSAQTVGILESIMRPAGKRFVAVDVLPDPRIRQELSALSNWPTIPQLFVDGELVGGCDIVTEMYQSGELQETLGVEAPPPEQQAGAGEQGSGQPDPRQSPPLSIENRL